MSSSHAFPRGIALVGYRGTGKTTVGQIVAQRLCRPFIDTDLVLESRFGKSIRAIFEVEGEPKFRECEAAILAEATADLHCVVATGGGAVMRPSNRQALRRFGFVVWLTATPEILAARLGADLATGVSRPPLTALGTLDEISQVLQSRTPFYQEVADLVIETDHRTPLMVAEAVLAALPPA
jgi:shikimate kinase